MLQSKLIRPTWPTLDGYIRCIRRQLFLWIPGIFGWLPLTVRFFLLIGIESFYNLYLFCFRPSQLATILTERIVEEGKGKRVAIVTGGTSGIGEEIVRALVKAGYQVHLPVRNMERGQTMMNELGNQIIPHQCDLSSIKQIRSFTDQFKRHCKKVDVLINNAGNFVPKFEVTEDNIESHMAIHVIGTFMMTMDLKDILVGGRVINTSSSAAYMVSHFDLRAFHDEQFFSRQGGYSNAKYAQTLLSNQLALELKEMGVIVNCVHPGMVNTNIIRGDPLGRFFVQGIVGFLAPFLLLTPREGALTPIWAAISEECTGATGRFLCDLEEIPSSRVIQADMASGHGLALLSYCENLVKSKL